MHLSNCNWIFFLLRSTIRRHKTVVILLITLCLISLLVLSSSEPIKRKRYPVLNVKNDTVLIFMATTYFGASISAEWMFNCPQVIKNSCLITDNPFHFPRADAVVFHSKDFDESKQEEFTHQFKRNLKVPYVILAQENPFYADLREYRHFFNWTMTYRQNSDVFYPYGTIIKNKVKEKINYTEIYRSKSKEAIWLVSNGKNTNNQRKKLVEKLVEMGMRIDLMGSLYQESPPNCRQKDVDFDTCESNLQNPYKFTIAFENNNCEDYVTEKFWRKASRYRMIPIVMQRKIYQALKIPDSMYIAVDDFRNLEDFIKHVKKVSENEEEFRKYHEWREDYEILESDEGDFGFCQLCHKVENSQKSSRKLAQSYENLAVWFGTDQCDNSFADKYLRVFNNKPL